MTMFSRTVSSMSSVSSCGTTPSRPRISTPSFAGSSPKTRSVPSVTGETQPIIRIVDVFPAPFGPRKPNASPRRRSKSIPSTALSSPNVLTSPRAWISELPFSPATGPKLAIGRPALRAPGAIDVSCELGDELILRLERRLVS